MKELFRKNVRSATLTALALGAIAVSTVWYFSHRSRPSAPVTGEPQVSTITPEPPSTAQNETQADASQAPSSTSPSASLPATTSCYDLSLAQESMEQRSDDKERRESVKEFLADKFQDQGVQVTLSGSNHQDLNYAALVDWPADEAVVRSHADSIKEAMINSRSKNDFCDADFARVRFIAIDNEHQSIHVLWTLSITKDAYSDITTDDQAAHDVAGQGQ